MKRNTKLVIVAVAVIAIVGIVLSQFASSDPDGLEYVAESSGFDSTAANHSLEDTPLADYGGDSRSRTAIAAAIGIAITLGVGWALFTFVGKQSESSPSGQ